MPRIVDTPLGQARQVAPEGSKGTVWVVACQGCGTEQPATVRAFDCPTCGWYQQARVDAVVKAAVARA